MVELTYPTAMPFMTIPADLVKFLPSGYRWNSLSRLQFRELREIAEEAKWQSLWLRKSVAWILLKARKAKKASATVMIGQVAMRLPSTKESIRHIFKKAREKLKQARILFMVLLSARFVTRAC
jgi:hypothetical protein